MATTLLGEVGASAISVRDVCRAAGITAPTLYHHFGDKQGLLEAVAATGFERYLAEKRRHGPSEDPLVDLRVGWDSHVGFGLAHPAFYELMYANTGRGTRAAAQEGLQVLHGILVRLAEQGRLRMTPREAVLTIHAACVGTTLILLSAQDDPAHEGLSHRVRDAVFAAVVEEPGSPRDRENALAIQVRALRATLSVQSDLPLSAGERLLLTELLVRLDQ
ncbi:TetR/AcrR family transcriptional regulator [Umezawaea beigongshangensis]|uniref:TetR/AcrR family transcriptional regulator n=1 Tax=Umezawaea beigongshangensis TaxID=2780383 RepID=UPI0018F22779|nr:TetR/AcrR family transcriptional regulator [Umezawaea beigongshangensis]